MANEIMKTLNTKIKLRYDSHEIWMEKDPVLMAGELALSAVTVKQDGVVNTVPSVLIKCGDGEHKYSELGYVFARAADVLDACKTEAGLKSFINGVIADAGIASDDAMQELAGKVTAAEGKITTLEGKMTTAEGKISANEQAIEAIEGRFGAETVALEINAAISALKLADTYAAKAHGHEIADVNGLSDSIAAAKKAGTDANAALEAYKTTNDAAVKVVSDSVAGIKNGETIDNFKEVEEALAGKQAAGNYSVEGHKHEIADVNGLETAIADAKKAGTDASAAAGQALTDAKAYTDSEMTRLVGDTKVATQIENYVNGLKLADTYAAKEHEHTKADITDFAHNHEMGEINGLAAEFAKKVDKETGKSLVADTEIARLAAMSDGANKVEASETNGNIKIDGVETVVYTHPEKHAMADITGLDTALAGKQDVIPANTYDAYGAAADALKDAKEYVDDELERLVGTDTVNAQISTALENALKVGEEGAKVEKYALATDLAAEAETARAAEKANADAIIKLNANAETAGSVDYKIAQAVAAIMDNPDETKNSINELVTWIDEHAEDALAMSNQVTANKNAIETLNGDASTTGSVDKKIADAIADENLDQYAKAADLEALDDRVEAIETEHNAETTGLKARLTQAEADIDALELLVGDDTVSKQITDVTNPLTERIVELEKVDHSHANATELDKIADGDKAKWDAKLEDVTAATDSGLKATKTGNTVAIEIDDTLTWIFDCGGAN